MCWLLAMPRNMQVLLRQMDVEKAVPYVTRLSDHNADAARRSWFFWTDQAGEGQAQHRLAIAAGR